MENPNHGIVPEPIHGSFATVDWLALAARHEAIALDLSQHMDGGSIAKAAHHFTVAAALRAKAGR